MMNTLSLTKATGGSEKAPDWQDVVSQLEWARDRGGVVALSLNAGDKYLELRCEGKCFLLSLGLDTGTGWGVRSYFNQNANEEMVDILGEMWDSKLICHDFDVVIDSFREFYETGDVSKSILE